MSNSRVLGSYPDIKQVNDERWVPPLPDASKPTILVPPCLGCSRLPSGHPGHEVCLRAEILRLHEEVRVLKTDEVRAAGIALLALRKSVAETQTLPHSKGGLIEFHLHNGKRRPE
jgi:hypothetical protein